MPLWWWVCVVSGVVVIAGAAVAGNRRRQQRAVQGVKRRLKQRERESKVAASHQRRLQQAPRTGYADGPTRTSHVLSTLVTQQCSARDCYMSKKPKYDKHGRLTCKCPCKGERHGKGLQKVQSQAKRPPASNGATSGGPRR